MNSQKYKITNVQTRDQWDGGFGMMQDYAIALEGEEGWIKLTQKPETRPPQIGDTLEGYIETKSNNNGETYKKFKKDSGNFQRNTPVDDGKLDYIIQMLEELTDRREIASEPELEDPFKDI